MSEPITAFLLARIAEDEAYAVTSQAGRCLAGEGNWSCTPACPERIKAECEVKRRFVDEYQHLADRGIGAVTAHAEWTCRILAAVYADHPAYDPGWRP